MYPALDRGQVEKSVEKGTGGLRVPENVTHKDDGPSRDESIRVPIAVSLESDYQSTSLYGRD